MLTVPRRLTRVHRVFLLKGIEDIRLATGIAEAGLLSKAEDLGVFSKLEGIGAFSLAEKLLPTRDRWTEASALLQSVDDATLQKNLDACVDAKTFKDVAMDQAGFIVYYEERRYGDLRLEPQTPSNRAEQNGRKKELMRALADEKAELAYLLKADDDPAELRAYAASARKALDDFLSLMP